MGTPSPNGSNGHDAAGRFAKGNPGGPGNPHASRVGELRATLLDAVTADDLRAIVAKLVTMAKGGDLAAIREVLDRTLGKPLAAVAVGLTADSTQITFVEDENWYGNPAHRLARQQVLQDPEYLDWCRDRAAAEDGIPGVNCCTTPPDG